MVDLSTLIPANAGLKLSAAFDINDRGEIVGQGMDPSCSNPDQYDFLYTFVLIPCDENHRGVEGCDYSLADTGTAQTAAPSYVPSAKQRWPQSRWMSRYHMPGLGVSPRN